MEKIEEIIQLEENLSITVKGFYTPAKKEILYTLNGDGYPGCNSEINIHSISINENNVLDYTIYIQNLLKANPYIDIIEHFSELIKLQIEDV